MLLRRKALADLRDRGPLRVMFVITSMPVGGAETLLVELLRRLDRARFSPQLCCLKELGPLGATMALEIPAHHGLLTRKTDVGVLWRLAGLMRRQRIDAVVTVGAGDKMFWGRLAARLAGVPVIAAALHSTGWPDRVQFANRLLAPITDAFIAVAEPHGRYLAAHEGCTAAKIHVIPNGVDVERFCPRPADAALRLELHLAGDAPVVGIVAALRPEKNHALFLRAAARVLRAVPKARFLIVGDGPNRGELEAQTASLSLSGAVRFLGTRSDVPEVLSLINVLALSSHMEANPVSILEAMAAGKPVVATRVGSVDKAVQDGRSGYLVPAGCEEQLAGRLIELLRDDSRAAAFGRAGREYVVEHASIERMVAGYEDMLEGIYQQKAAGRARKKGDSPLGTAAADPAGPGQLQSLGAGPFFGRDGRNSC
jgi:glycosyltransferase involved in cell wall biosynthesis